MLLILIPFLGKKRKNERILHIYVISFHYYETFYILFILLNHHWLLSLFDYFILNDLADFKDREGR